MLFGCPGLGIEGTNFLNSIDFYFRLSNSKVNKWSSVYSNYYIQKKYTKYFEKKTFSQGMLSEGRWEWPSTIR